MSFDRGWDDRSEWGKRECLGVQELVICGRRAEVVVARRNREWLGSRRGRRTRRGGNAAKEGLEYRLVHSYECCSLFFGKPHHPDHVFDHKIVGGIFIVRSEERRVGKEC